ncbi:MAG: maltose operon protein [Psychromonas sp.]
MINSKRQQSIDCCLFYLEDKILKKLWLVVLVSLLAACSSGGNVVTDVFRTWNTQFSDVAELTAKLRTKQIKPVPVINLPFQMLSLDSNNRIDITDSSPVVNFPQGKSFVAALLLPEQISRFTFSLESITGRTVFVPSVVFLNENLQEVSHSADAQFTDEGVYSIENAFTAEMTQAIRYVLVYSKDSVLDGKTELVDPIREYEKNKGNDLSESSYPKVYAKHSPIGHLNIRLKDVFFSAPLPMIGENTTKNEANQMTIKTIDAAPTILSDTEEFYLQQISKALKEDNLSRAKSLVKEAERAGSTKAKSHYLKELGKQQ